MKKIAIQLTEKELDDMKVALQCYKIDVLLRGNAPGWFDSVEHLYQIIKKTQSEHERKKESRIARDRA